MEGLKFFTDKTVINDYLLIKIVDYIKMKDFSPWQEVYIDPGIWDLKKSDSFKWEGTINIDDFLYSLPDNHYFSWDYPPGLNELYTELFIEKTWANANLYNNHSQYIVTVQSKFNNYISFKEQFDRFNTLYIASGIIAIGMGRFKFLTEYLKHALDYAFSHCKHSRIHIYGLCLRAIPYAYKLSQKFDNELSVDSTKWTRACTNKLKLKYGLNCSNTNRQEFFDEYKKEIEVRIK